MLRKREQFPLIARPELPGGATLISKPITPDTLSVAVRDRLAAARKSLDTTYDD